MDLCLLRGLLEDACQVVTLGLLGREEALRPRVQQPTKPAIINLLSQSHIILLYTSCILALCEVHTL